MDVPGWVVRLCRGRLLRLLVKPRPWTVVRLWAHLGRPAMWLRTLRRRVREVAKWRRPRLAVKGDPEEATKIALIGTRARSSCGTRV